MPAHPRQHVSCALTPLRSLDMRYIGQLHLFCPLSVCSGFLLGGDAHASARKEPPMRLRLLVAAAAVAAIPVMLGGATASASSTVVPAAPPRIAQVTPHITGCPCVFSDNNGIAGHTFALHGHALNRILDTENGRTIQKWALVPTRGSYHGFPTYFLNLKGTRDYAQFVVNIRFFELKSKVANATEQFFFVPDHNRHCRTGTGTHGCWYIDNVYVSRILLNGRQLGGMQATGLSAGSDVGWATNTPLPESEWLART
jgi:hypothetical protein